MRRLYPDIEDLRRQVVDLALLIIALILTLSLIGIVRSVIKDGLSILVAVNFVIVAIFDVLALFRKRIPTDAKTYLVIFFITVIFILETFYWGLLVSSEAYIFLILIFFFGFISYRKSIIYTLCYIAVYILIGYLFHRGILTVREKYNDPGYLSEILPWVISALHVLITAFAILFAMHRFSEAYMGKINSLKASESRYRSLSETANTGIWQLDNEGKTEFINEAMYRILEADDREAIMAHSYLDFVAEESRKTVIEETNKRQKGQSSTYEIILLSKKGNKKSVVVTGSPLYDQDNRVIGRIGTFIDLTGIRKAETALAESEKRFREMAELLPQVVYEADINGVLTYVNKNGQEAFGADEETLKKGVTILSTIDPEDHPRLKKNMALISKQGSMGGNEYTMVRFDGTKYPALIYSSPIINNGLYCGLRGTVVDITDRKKYEETLKASEKWFRDLVDLSPYGVGINDMSGRFIHVNHKFLEHTGFVQQDVIGKTPEEINLILNYENYQKSTEELLKKGSLENHEAQIVSKNGHTVDLLFSRKILKMFDQDVILTVTIDITEKNRMERELEKHRNHLEELVQERTDALAAANEELLATNEELFNQREELESLLRTLHETKDKLIESEKMASLGVLASGISHEINNPLNFIQGGLYGLEDYAKNNLLSHREAIEPMFQVINEGIKRASKIVSSLNHFSRKTESQDEQCDIHKILENCLIMLHNQLKNKVEVIKKYTGESASLKGNEGKLHQAFLNILSNAEQSITGNGEITIKTEVERNDLVITISDTGCGISHENLPKVFDPFFTTKDPGKGTGLGLSITYNIIKDHGGEISLKSKLDSGTEVIIKLPAS